MKDFLRQEPLFSLCGLNCGLCTMHLGGHCPGCGGGAGNQSCSLARCSSSTAGCFLLDVPGLSLLTGTRGLTTMTPSSPIGTGSETSPRPRRWGWKPT